MSDPLFEPTRLGALELYHRVVMAPLTRLRSAQPGDIPTTLNAEYYGQRASQGGLLITEATDIAEDARGYPGAPGVHSPEQIAGWRLVTAAVHAKGGLIVNQIWHCGRISHSSMRPDGSVPVAPSAIAAAGGHVNARGEGVAFETPHALSVSEIAAIVAEFRQAAVNAKDAGFDGVEVHGANGYLLDQFLRDGSNQRSDSYGGSFENRTRFLLEVVDAVAEVWGPERVGVRLSPWGSFNDMRDSDTGALFDHVVGALAPRGLAYLHLVEPRADQTSDVNALHADAPDAASRFKRIFSGPVIAAGGFTHETGAAAVAAGNADAIAYGRLFIANPDLPERFRTGASLNRHDRSTFYGGGAKGYTDYPFLG
ncbi:alkene reductase [Plastoroseomonas arctica]|uniref:Alkene reductase n=1 Tax=Plastoroseomonas arctica TaxID=1509237 RepID=A0AAF1JZC3_9PROT|nr:alkene reductase [Plastoroseomonas arctica]MBR0656620.1 alkene reductase [Plastoroseomonas arctica]